MRAGHDITMPLRLPPKCEATLLCPLHWRIHRVRPTNWIMVVGPRSAQLINHREEKRYAFLDAIGGSADFICRTLQGSFGARTVVAHHENDERVVHLTRLLHRVE